MRGLSKYRTIIPFSRKSVAKSPASLDGSDAKIKFALDGKTLNPKSGKAAPQVCRGCLSPSDYALQNKLDLQMKQRRQQWRNGQLDMN